MAGRCPAASRPSRCAATTASPWATRRSRACARSGTARVIGISAARSLSAAAARLRELRAALEPLTEGAARPGRGRHPRPERGGADRRCGPRGPRARVDEIIVVDNGSTDRTAERARAAGARVGHRAAARLRPGVPGRHRRSRCRLRHHCVSRRRRQRLSGASAAADRADPGGQAGFRDRLADTRPARARQHESRCRSWPAGSPACCCASCMVCATPICARFAPSGARRSAARDARDDLWLEPRDADARRPGGLRISRCRSRIGAAAAADRRCRATYRAS